MERPLKIAVSIWSFCPNTGGLQSHTESLCKYLRNRGHDVRVITRSATQIPQGSDYLFRNEPSDHMVINGISVRALRFSKLWWPLLWVILKAHARSWLCGVAARLYPVVAATSARTAFAGFDVIHHVGHSTALMGLASADAARRHGIPLLVQPMAHPANFGDSKSDFRLYHRADQLLVNTVYERDFFLSKGITCPLAIVGSAVEDRRDGQGARFREKHGIKDLMILYVGRKAIDKGYQLITEAFTLLRAKYPTLTLVCMGPSDPGIEVKRIEGIVELDYVSEDEKHDALAACTCLCVPSVSESFGLIYMEAGRYAKPVVGRDLPVLRELLGNKNAAMLLGRPNPTRNTAGLTRHELAAGLERLLDDPKLRREIGERCYDVSATFLWPKMVGRFEKAYTTALKTRPTRQ